MIYRLTLAYRGTRYAGWQRQRNALAVQQVVEEALGELLASEPRLVGAGRTDAGVHAAGQVAHCELEEPFPERGLVLGTNQRLPEDIRVLEAARMGEGFHALGSARSKRYLYRLSRAAVLSPLVSPFVAPVSAAVDPERLARATAAVVGLHDFSAFALAGGSHSQPSRRVFSAAWEEAGEELRLSIEGEGFLRGMVRSLVGTLIEVGLGKRSPEDFAALLEGGARSAAGPTAPARGLLLAGVDYGPACKPLSVWPARGDPPGGVVA